MNAKKETWMDEFDKQLRRGKHVLLYGNVEDRYPCGEWYEYLDKYLNKYFTLRGYNAVVHYDIADEGCFASENAQGVGSCKTFSDLRTLLCGQNERPAAVIFDFTDRMFGNVQQQTEPERKMLIQLRKMLTQSRDIPSETLQAQSDLSLAELSGRQNTMIFVASQLQSVPSWFYQDHPSLALIRIPRPEKEEREDFIRKFLSRFVVCDMNDESENEKIIQTFKDNADGLTIGDMISLSHTAKSENRRVSCAQQMKDLIFYYRYGNQEDPWESFNRDRIREAFDKINERVIGQNEAVRTIVNMLKTANVGISMSASSSVTGGKPKGVFFFVGPTGVGKTELAKALAELIFGDENRMHRFDMSEYSESHAAEKLTGSPPGYVGYEEGGQLTNFVRENPFSILLFDEIEKANGKVMDKFLQILEDGRLTDGKGLTVYFSQCIIIFTSNIGSDTLLDRPEEAGMVLDSSRNAPRKKGVVRLDEINDEKPAYHEIREHYISEVQQHFVATLGRPEIFNRLGNNILVFDLLRPNYIRGIFAKFMHNLERSARQKRYILEYDTADGSVTNKPEESALCQWILTAMKERGNLLFGGRRIRVQMEEKIEQPLNGWIFDKNPPELSCLTLGVDEGKLTVTPKSLVGGTD